MWGFLTVFALCGLAGIEAWPFSGFRLFSNLRTDRIAGWEVTVADHGDADEHDVSFGERSWVHVAAGMAQLPDEQRMAVCRAWVHERGVDVRIYRTWTPIGGGPVSRELRASCEL